MMSFVLYLVLASFVTTTNAQFGRSIAVTEKTIKGEVLDMLWVGKDEKTVYILTDKNILYRSTDEGKSWSDEMSRLKRSDSTGGVVSMELSGADKNRLVFLSDGRVHWATSDAGRTYKQITDTYRFHEVKLHPKDGNMMLTCVLSDKCHDSSESGYCYKKLYVSKDFGKSWKFLTDYIVQFDWAHNLQRGQADKLPKVSVMASEFKSKRGDQRFGYWDRNIDFVISNDLWESKPRVLVPRGNRFLFTSKFLFVAKVHHSIDNRVSLQISSNGGKTWSTAALPFGELHQHSYTILDTSEDSVFLHVNHIGEKSSWGNVYISNADGLGYALSLPHNRRATSGKCDFEKVEGMTGIYLANYIDNVDQLERSRGSKKKRGGKKNEEAVRTVVTFDKGAIWSYLRPPSTDANGRPIMCGNNDCSLHLHGITSEWGPFYTTSSSLGLIMATGNVGTKLSYYGEDINTYFSRDAGLTWFEVAKGSHIYEFGDHGALIVMANDQKATTTLKYSWNEGMSWESFEFTDRPMDVVNIIIEPTATSQNFVVYGARRNPNGEYEGVVISLDFGELHQRACTGAENPDDANSDFEKWSPHDGRTGDQCILGHKVWYTRRKRDSECFNGMELERSHDIKICECDEYDYECDVGYQRKIDGGPCLPTRPVNTSALVPSPCPSGSKYYVTHGYRKIVGDRCVGGVNHDPAEFYCPGLMGSVSHGGWFVLFLIFGLVGGLGYVTYFKDKRGRSRFSKRSFSAYPGGNTLDYVKGVAYDLFETARRMIPGQNGMGGGRNGGYGYVQYSGIDERVPDSAIDDLNNMAGSGDFGGDAFDDDGDDGAPELMDQDAISQALQTRTHDDVDVDSIPILDGPGGDDV
eukprot:g6763.t1